MGLSFPAFPYLCPLFMNKVIKRASVLVFCVLVAACLEQPDCFNLINNSVNISYRKIADGALDTVAIEAVSIVGLDSVFALRNTGALLPLDFTKNTISVVLDDVERTRLLAIGYRVQPQFVSEECGPRFQLSDLTVSSPSGDSVRVLSSTPGGNSAHIGVYRCPRNNMVRIAFKQNASRGVIRDTVVVKSTSADFQAFTIYPSAGSLSFMNLPLNSNASSTRITLQFSDNTEAKLTFTYNLVRKTVYQVCGEQTFITNVRASADVFDMEMVESSRYVTDSIYDPPKINFAAFQ